MAVQLGVESEVDRSSAYTARRSLLAALAANRPGSARLAVDGLDEAADPHAVAGLLDETGRRRRARARRVPGPRCGTHADAADDLLRALGVGRPYVTRYQLQRDPAAIAQYVRRRLVAARRRPRLDAEVPSRPADHLIGIAVERITTQGLGGHCDFLFARLVVQEMLADPALLTPEGDARLAGC